MASGRKIKLDVYTQTVFVDNLSQNYKISITATSGVLMPNEIFYFTYKEPSPGYADGLNTFVGVCTPSMLQCMPIDEPDLTSDNRYFRSSTVTLYYDNPTLAEDGITQIVAAVRQLKKALDHSDSLKHTEIWVA